MPKNYSLQNKNIWIAGHNGLVGSALCRRLERENCSILSAKRAELDCRDQVAVLAWMRLNKPDAVIIAAAKVGGIAANMNAPAEFLYDNLMIAANIIHAAYESGAQKLLFLGSSCIYPKDAQNPITEEALLTGSLEPTNAPYALAKIAGVKLCESYRAQYGCDFISAMPCNLYGPGDNFDLENAHVIPALIRKAHEAVISGASELEIWGSGKPRREFMYVDDLADALVFLLQHYSGAAPVNIGAGGDVTIAALAETIANIVGFKGALRFNDSRPDGVSQKLLDCTIMREKGWKPSVSLEYGLSQTYEWYVHALESTILRPRQVLT